MTPDIIEVNNVHYIRLSDVLNTCRILTLKYGKGSDDEKITPYAAALSNLTEFMTYDLTSEEIFRDTDEYIRFLNCLMDERYENRYVITTTEKGTKMYYNTMYVDEPFRFEENEYIADTWTDVTEAIEMASKLKEEYNIKCQVEPYHVAKPEDPFHGARFVTVIM